MLELKMVVGITGGRAYDDSSRVWRALDHIQPRRILVGCAQGADGHARNWAMSRCIEYLVFVAKWNELGKAAGPMRNMAIVRELKRLTETGERVALVHFPGSRGTADCKAKARDAGIQLIDGERF